MAKVYRLHLNAPNYDYNDFRSWQEVDKKYYEDARAECKSVCSHDLAGEIVRFPIADGYAEYMVWSVRPLALVHLETSDAYQIPAAHMRGLNLADIKQSIEWERKWRAISG